MGLTFLQRVLNEQKRHALAITTDPTVEALAQDVQDNAIDTANHATAITNNTLDVGSLELNTGLPATNLVTNGDFSNGTTGWGNSGATLAASNNALTVTGSGTLNNANAIQFTQNNNIVNNKIYVLAKLKVTNSNCTALSLRINKESGGSEVLIASQSSPSANVQYKLSGIGAITATTEKMSIFIRHQYADAATANGKVMEVQYVSSIDLTATFGAGNEPTVTEMDAILAKFPNNWFNGTVEQLMTLKEVWNWMLKKKADIAQEAWITPTLLNGATGTIKYMKDQMGFVHFKGTVVIADVSKNFMTMPVGYRMTENGYFATSRSDNTSSIQKITLLSQGTIWGSVNGTIYMDGITFKAEA